MFDKWNKYGAIVSTCFLLSHCCDPAAAQTSNDCRAGTTEARLECLAKRLDDLQGQNQHLTHIQSTDPRLQDKCIVVLDHEIAGTPPFSPLVVDTCKSGNEGLQGWRLTGE
jgi:hypothetical protein